jgi:hypothetical protein
MHCTILISISAGAHDNEFAMRMFETDEREFNNSSAAELEHKWQKKYHNICILMNLDYGFLWLYNYGLFKIEYREVQLKEKGKNNVRKKWKDICTW